MKKRFLFLIALLYIQPVYAYLDPGTGSMLLAVLVGVVSTLLFFLRTLWHRLSTRLFFRRGVQEKFEYNKNIVLYSVGGQYWNTFYTLIRHLEEKKICCSYLTSDEHDPGLQYESPYVHCAYIGSGNKAYAYLNLLETKVCIMTTPNIDVLQIQRSKRVQHYAHVIHAPTDIHLYKLFAFDFYDSVMISGPHQEKSIRFLENLRNTNKKELFHVGCTYMDILQEKREGSTQSQSKSTTILLAPTWGQSGLLFHNGKKLLQMLIDEKYSVIVRPHPQSLVVEKELISGLQEDFKNASNLRWDQNPDNFPAMAEADVLVSDRSGIIFDFAFIFEKPVITHTVPTVLLGMEGNDIPWPAWELDVLNTIGATVEAGVVQDGLKHTIDGVLAEPNRYKEQIKELRKAYLYNPGSAGKHAADVIENLVARIEDKH